eukprot:3880249-Prymnesium_polylepis.1
MVGPIGSSFGLASWPPTARKVWGGALAAARSAGDDSKPAAPEKTVIWGDRSEGTSCRCSSPRTPTVLDMSSLFRSNHHSSPFPTSFKVRPSLAGSASIESTTSTLNSLMVASVTIARPEDNC